MTIAGVQEAVRTPGSLPWKRPQATPSLLVPCCRGLDSSEARTQVVNAPGRMGHQDALRTVHLQVY